MGEVQIIVSPSGEELVVLPRAEYDRMIALVEDALDEAEAIAIYDARKADPEDDVLPAELTALILQGDGRLRAARKYRKLTQAQLAERAGIAQGYLSDLEARRRTASGDVLGRLAAVLDVPRG
jgi:DNA-binding XRE family transcriptional regulator